MYGNKRKKLTQTDGMEMQRFQNYGHFSLYQITVSHFLSFLLFAVVLILSGIGGKGDNICLSSSILINCFPYETACDHIRGIIIQNVIFNGSLLFLTFTPEYHIQNTIQFKIFDIYTK